MASGDKEHKMLFDLRGGRRRSTIKVVYAVLAVLMGASLFLTVGPLNVGEVFNSTGSAGDAAEPYEEQAERIEAKLRKAPGDEQLLMSLSRAQVLAGNSLLSLEPSEDDLVDALQQYQQASNTWSEYLRAAKKEPSAGTAQLVAPALVTLAERSRTYQEAAANIQAASDAQRIVAEQRPTLNSFSTLALYTYFTGDFAAAEKAEAEAKKLTNAESEREQVEKQLGEVKKNAKKFRKELEQAEAATKAAAKNEGPPPSLQGSSGPLGGAFGGSTGLGE